VSLGRAVRDPRLLGSIAWWEAQLQIFDAIEAHRTSIVSVGRQSGKTSIAAAAAVWDATLRPDLDLRMMAGRVRYALIACPSEHQAKEVVEICGALLEASPVLRGFAVTTATRLDFRIPRTRADGTTFEARTSIRALAANSRTLRGLSSSLIVCDELAHFTDAGGPSSDERMWTALLPSTRMFGPEARVIASSTPAGMHGKFYELFEQASAGLLPSSIAVQAATGDVVPNVDPEWLEGQRTELGEGLWRQEYFGEFISGAGSFFGDLDALEFEDGPALPGDADTWTAAVDPSFHGDKFGVALLGESLQESGQLILGPVAALEPVGNARSFEQRRAREDATLAAVWELIEPYHPARVVTDQHQASAIESYFGRRGVRVEVVNLTGAKQTAAFVTLRSRLVDGSLRLWRHPQLIEDLRRVRAKDSESISLPRYGGSHCDAAAALALGCLQLAPRASRAFAAPAQSPRWPGYLSNGGGGFDASPIDGWTF
jgi:GNAT superfamily N-acetyltransferase